MLEQHAMRYLLARQLWVLRKSVDPKVYEEVSASLVVSRDGDAYDIAWRRGGEGFQRRIPRDSYHFYRRGDRPDSEGVVESYEQKNLAQARLLAADILGVDASIFHRKALTSLISARSLGALLWTALLCAVSATVEPSARVVCALLFLTCVLEFVPKWGRLLAVMSLLVYGPAGWPVTALAAGVFFALSHHLDPDPTWRRTRIGLSVAAGLLGLFRIVPTELLGQVDMVLPVLAIVMFFVTLFRWTVGAHFRIVPIFLPVAAVALHLDGAPLAALTLAAGSIGALVAVMFGWRLLPHPSGATHQGVSSNSWQ